MMSPPDEQVLYLLLTRLLEAHGCFEDWMKKATVDEILERSDCDYIPELSREWWDRFAIDIRTASQYVIQEESLF